MHVLYDSRTIGTLGPRNARWYSLCVDHIPLPCLETLLFLRLFHLTHTYVPPGPLFFYFRSRESTAPSVPSTPHSTLPFPRPISLFLSFYPSLFFLPTSPTKLRINSSGRFGTPAKFSNRFANRSFVVSDFCEFLSNWGERVCASRPSNLYDCSRASFSFSLKREINCEKDTFFFFLSNLRREKLGCERIKYFREKVRAKKKFFSPTLREKREDFCTAKRIARNIIRGIITSWSENRIEQGVLSAYLHM